MKVVGVDVGSTMLKAVAYDGANIESMRSYIIAGDPLKATKTMLSELKRDKYIFGVTGSSRKLVGDYLKARIVKPEIIAHLKGVKLNQEGRSLIFEIGGQDSKLLIVEDGEIQNFKMNSNCAAGTGSFIEAQSRRFNMSVEEFDTLADSTSEKPRNINTKCATFLESALINLQRQFVSREAIALTVFYSLAKNYIETMCSDICINDYERIYFLGGVAKIKTMKKCFEYVLNRELIVPENCEYTGAIGMAELLHAYSEKERKLPHRKERIQCEDCNNKCELSRVIINGCVKYVGGICGKYNA